MLRNKHLNRGAKTALILSRLTHLIDTIQNDNDENLLENVDLAKDPMDKPWKVTVPNRQLSPLFLSAKPVVICIFQIRKDGLVPFILFLLQKTKTDQTMNFISLPVIDDGTINDFQDIQEVCIAYIEPLLPLGLITYQGFFTTTEQNIIILNYSPVNAMELDAEPEPIPNPLVWSTPHEIINMQKVLNCRVHKNVIDFFILNLDFLRIRDDKNSIYATPLIGYYCAANRDDLDIYREIRLPALGKRYYLLLDIPTDLKNTTVVRAVFFPQKLAVENYKKKEYDTLFCTIASLQYFIINNYNHQTALSVVTDLD
jgi:hypothetical protein